MKAVQPVRVLLVDDHEMMREGLGAVLDREGTIEVVGQASDGRSAIERVAELEPDLVLMDVGLKDMSGIEAARRISQAHPDVKILALSAYSDRRYIVNMLKAGAAGYVLKDSASSELLRAVTAVMRGNEFLSPEITSTVLDGCLRREQPTEEGGLGLLGNREREVLQLIAEGMTTPQIAKRLFIADKTVETHRRNLMRKLKLRTIAELTKFAVREGLTSLEG